MQRLGPELDLPSGVPTLVLAGEVALENQRAVARDQHGVRIGIGPGIEMRTDPADQFAVEPHLFRRRDGPSIRQVRRLVPQSCPPPFTRMTDTNVACGRAPFSSGT